MKDRHSQAYPFNRTPRYIKNAERENGLKEALTTRRLKLKLSLCQLGSLPSFCTPASRPLPATGAWTFDLLERNLRKARPSEKMFPSAFTQDIGF